MRTSEIKAFYVSLSELNNSFTHYSLVWNQFGLDYVDIFGEKPDMLTKDLFTNNPYRKKHNIRIGELQSEHSKTHEILIKGIFLLIYTQYEKYLKDLLSFAIKVDDSIQTFESKLDGIDEDSLLIDKLFNRVSIDKSLMPLQSLLTLDYVRLKRNRLIHSNSETISNSLNRLMTTYGQDLNEYWNRLLPSNLQGIDFSDKGNANTLNFSIVIDTINIFRKVTLEIDNLVTDRLTSIEIVEKIVIPKFMDMQRRNLKGIKFERLTAKFNKFCISEYGIEVDSEMIDILNSSIA